MKGRMQSFTVDLPDEAATVRLGAELATSFAPLRGVIALRGDLGAGKTTLARAFLRALGLRGTVRSPTYTLLEPYALASGTVLHMDLYRLADPLELANLGLDDYPTAEVLWLVEWPERAGPCLPEVDLQLELQHRPPGRCAVLRAEAALAQRLQARFRSAGIQSVPDPSSIT
jgi:tRNA threonylcarbamoyladenosine biosynthesis protein TsaE